MSQHSSATLTTMQQLPEQQQRQQHTIQLQQVSSSDSNSLHEPPPPPVPSSDPELVSHTKDASTSTDLGTEAEDLFKLPAIEAVKLLSASIEVLVQMTGDVPPTPPLKHSTDPQMSDMQAEKDSIARSHSDQNLARLRQLGEEGKRKPTIRPQTSAGPSDGSGEQDLNKIQTYKNAMKATLTAQQSTSSNSAMPQAPDGVQLKKGLTSPISPSAQNPSPYLIIGADSQPINLQHGAITRKFYSKNEPPITITAYLLRLHQFCPMSTAVYLATSLYIHRLAIEERAIPVTRRNAHRLVLAGLRVAMKALEDLSYSHSKIAKVGGVSELELARLEVSFCFLTGFELVVGEEKLLAHWASLRNGKAQQILKGMEVPTLRLMRKPRKVNPPPDG